MLEGESRRERVRTEPRDPGHLARVAHDVDREALLRAGLGHVEAGALGQGRAIAPRAVVEHEAGGERGLAGATGPLRGGLAPADPAGPGEVHDEMKVALPLFLERQVEELAMPVRVGHRAAGERRDRRVEGLERREGHDLEPLDDPAAQAGAEVRHEGMHLGQLRHVTSLHRAADLVQRRSGAAASDHDGFRVS